MTNFKAVYDELRAQRTGPDKAPVVAGPGVYALFAREPDCMLPYIVMPEDGLLYIGESGDLSKRKHFKELYTGFSSLRRSLGAILKAQLRLTALPRPSGSSEAKYTNFRFTNEGERRLSEWMKKNLEYAAFPYNKDKKQLEAHLIENYEPPLNLKGWKNPQGKSIRCLRRLCRDEARNFDRQTG